MSMLTQVLIATLVTKFSCADLQWNKSLPDVGLNVVNSLFRTREFGAPPYLSHSVQSSDGYLLELYRIPNGRYNTNLKERPAVLLVSGFVCDSAVWVSRGTKSLGFLLADRGYDVWLANCRGTTWSRKHVKLNPDADKKEFWDFSFEKIGIYDLPAFIDYILKTASQKNLFYVGHSQGTTSVIALLSAIPDYNSKIRLSLMLAPAAYFSHSENALVPLFKNINLIYKILESTDTYEILRHSNLITQIADILCRDGSPVQHLCVSIFASVAGSGQLNQTEFPVILSNIPAGSSFLQFMHFAQIFSSGVFKQFDYGAHENMIRYGQIHAPQYNISKVTAPFALYYGGSDLISPVKDVEKLASELSNVVVKNFIQGFSHLDFLWGTQVYEMLYKNIFDLMEKY